MAFEVVDKTASQSYSNYTKVDEISEFGGEEDLWGAESITIDQLQRDDFIVKFDAEELGGNTLRVDALTVEVFYELPNFTADSTALPPWWDEVLQAGAIAQDGTGTKVYLVCGRDGLIRKSSDGQNWIEVESGVADTLRDIKATLDGAVAVGDNGAIVKTTDAVTFVREVSGSVETLNSIAYNANDGAVIVVGQGGVITAQAPSTTLWGSVRN